MEATFGVFWAHYDCSFRFGGLKSNSRCLLLMITVLALTVIFSSGTLIEPAGSQYDLLRKTRDAPTGQPIPPEILRQLKASKTRSELYEKVKIINSASPIPAGSTRSGATQIPNTRIGSNLPDDKEIQIQSILSEDFGTGLMARNSSDDIIEDGVQSQDSCKIFTLCVPLPIDAEPNIYYQPSCVDLPQCVGGCCDTTNQCHAVEKQSVKFRVVAYKYLGIQNGQPTLQFYKDLLVPMERHLSCSCTDCQTVATCNSKQELNDCQCRCKNQDEMIGCIGQNQRWSNEDCVCLCEPVSCFDGDYFDYESCQCQNINDVTNKFTPNSAESKFRKKNRLGSSFL